MKKTVFWDFDGTLAEAPHLWSGAVFRASAPVAKKFGITFSAIRPLLWGKYPWDAGGETPAPQDWWPAMCETFSKAYQSFGVDEETAGRLSLIAKRLILSPESYRLYPDAISALAAAKDKGYENCILSNNYPELAETCAALGLSPYVYAVVTSGLAGFEKPRREIFNLARKEAGNPGLCYMVGDNPASDIEGGKNAGMKTVLVHSQTPCGANFHAGSLLSAVSFLK